MPAPCWSPQSSFQTIIIITSYSLTRMATLKCSDKKPLQLKVKDGKLSCRQKKRRSDCIPQLVIDLQDQRIGRNSLSNWSVNYGSTMSMIIENQLDNDKENCGKQRAISFKNPSSLKTKYNENLKQELEFLRTENESLKGENVQLKYRVMQLEETQKQTIQNEINELKHDLESSRSSTIVIEEKYIEMRYAYEEACVKVKQLYDKLLEEKRWQRSLTELVVSLDYQNDLDGELALRAHEDYQKQLRREPYIKQSNRESHRDSHRESHRDSTKTSWLKKGRKYESSDQTL